MPAPNFDNTNDRLYNPDILRELDPIGYRYGFGYEYEYFINGTSFAGKAGFSCDQIYEQFKNIMEFKRYVERDKNVG